MTSGDWVAEQRHTPTTTQLFRYSAVTWNSHRIHYDQAYARSEGYPDVLVQSHLHGAFLAQLCTDWAGRVGTLTRLQVSVRRFAVPGDVLVCRARLKEQTVEAARTVAYLDLEEVRESDGTVCATGQATIVLRQVDDVQVADVDKCTSTSGSNAQAKERAGD